MRKSEQQVPFWVWMVLIPLTTIALILFIIVNFFVVDRVIVKNNTLYEAETIREAVLNDDMSWNTVYVYLKYKLTDADDIPYVDALEVSMADSTTLMITVYEKGIMGFLRSTSQKKVYFDEDGIVTEISDRDIEGIPEISGMACSEAVLYEPLPIDKTAMKDLLSLTTSLRRSGVVPDKITYGYSTGPVMDFPNAIEVMVGDTRNLTQKIERMAAILPLIKEKGILHLENWTEETRDIVFQRGVSVSDLKVNTIYASPETPEEDPDATEDPNATQDPDSGAYDQTGLDMSEYPDTLEDPWGGYQPIEGQDQTPGTSEENSADPDMSMDE